MAWAELFALRNAGLSNDAFSNATSHTTKGSEAASQLPAGGRDAFKGYWFTLTAMTHEQDMQCARNIILQNGGKLFTARVLSLVTNKAADSLFAVCPVSLPLHQLDALRKQPQFQIGDSSACSRPCWLVMSLQRACSCLLPSLFLHMPYYSCSHLYLHCDASHCVS